MDSVVPPKNRHQTLTAAASAIAVYELGERLFRQGKQHYEARLAYTVRVMESDRIYDAVVDWLMTLIPDGKHRQLVASSTLGARYTDDLLTHADEPDRKNDLRVYLHDSQTFIANVDGHSVRIQIDQQETAAVTNTGRGQTKQPSYVQFVCRTRAAQQTVLGHIREITHSSNRSEPVLMMAGSWGDWQRRADLPLRDMDTLALPAQQKRFLIEDLQKFLEREDQYNALGIPWHRGYMLHGRPGTGKTSLAKAVATHFGMDLWCVSLADLSTKSDVLSLIRNVRPRSILLLEDIDTVTSTHDRDEVKHNPADDVSLGSLLNALDGVGTPHGLVTIMTTNHFDKLDPALTRPGRMDVIEEIALPGPGEIRHLFGMFYPGADLATLDDLVDTGLSHAQVSECFKRHMEDPEAGERALLAEILHSRRTVLR